MYTLSDATTDLKQLFDDDTFKHVCLAVNPKLKTTESSFKSSIDSAYKILLKLIKRQDLYKKLSKDEDEILVCDRFTFIMPLLAGFYLCKNFSDDRLEYMRHQLTGFINYYKDYLKEPRIYLGDYDFREMLNRIEETYEKNQEN